MTQFFEFLKRNILVVVISALSLWSHNAFSQCGGIGAFASQPTVTAFTTTTMTLNWGRANSATEYKVYYRKGAVGGYNVFGTVSTLNATVNILDPGSQYFFFVEAIRRCTLQGMPDSESIDSNSTSNTTLPLKVNLREDLSIATSTTTIRFNWSPVVCQFYAFNMATSPNFELSSYIRDSNNNDDINWIQGANATEVTYAFFSPGTNYYYQVRAFSPHEGEYSNRSGAIPTRPVTPVASPIPNTDINTTSFTTKWVALNGNATKYHLDVSTVNTFATKVTGFDNKEINANSHLAEGVTPGGHYFVRTRAFTSKFTTPYSNTVEVRTKPSLLPALNITSTSVDASWATAANIEGYLLDVSTKSDFTSFVAGYDGAQVTGTTKKIEGLAPATEYYYRIRTIRANVQSMSSDFVKIITKPAAPNTLTHTEVTTTSMKINWDAAAGATFYRFDGSTGNAFEPQMIMADFNNKEIVGTSTNVSVSGLTAGTEYHYRVRTVAVSGTSVNSQTLSSFTLPPVPVWKDQSESKADRIDIRWEQTRSATAYVVEASTTESFDQQIPGYPLEIPASNTNKIVVGLSPLTVYRFRVMAKNSSGLSAPSIIKAVSTSDPSGNLPTTELLLGSFNDTHISGRNAEITMTANNSGGPVKVTLKHKKRSEVNFTAIELVKDAAGRFKISATDDWFDSFGMEFYVEALDVFGNTKRDPAGDGAHVIVQAVDAFQVPVTRFGKDPDNYQVISFPYIMSKTAIEDILVPVMGEYNKSSWRFLQYQGDGYKDYQNDGLRLQDVKQGTSYWFLTKNDVKLQFTSGKSYSHSSSQPFVMRLKKGWNQVGNPFTFPLSWSSIIAANNNPEGVSALHIFRGEDSSFPESDLLKVFGGGFVFADNDIDIRIPATLPPASGRADGNNERTFEQTPGDWMLPLTLKQGNVTNSAPGIGMTSDARNAKDKFDKVTPPGLVRFLEFNSRAEAFDYNLARNIVAPSSEFTWTYKIESSSTEEVELTWDKETVRSVGGSLILWDDHANVMVNMSNSDSYTAGASAKFRIMYSDRPLAEEWTMQQFGMPYPNPFTNDVTIPVTYLEKGLATAVIHVTDAMGSPVFEGQVDAAKGGVVTISWNGKSSTGNDAPSGLYLFKILGVRSTDNKPFTLDGKFIKR